MVVDRAIRVGAALVLLCFAFAEPGSAQSRLSVTPNIGLFSAGSWMGNVTEASGNIDLVKLRKAPVIGFAVDGDLSTRLSLTLRGSLMPQSNVLIAQPNGFASCGTNCSKALTQYSTMGVARAGTVSFAAKVKLAETANFGVAVDGGIGLRQYRFSQPWGVWKNIVDPMASATYAAFDGGLTLTVLKSYNVQVRDVILRAGKNNVDGYYQHDLELLLGRTFRLK